jgi:hypothetical protein
MAISTPSQTPQAFRPQALPEASRNRTVVAWAGIGAAFVALMTYVFASWMLSDDFRHIGTGVTPVPTYMEIAARAQEGIGIVGMLAVLYFVVWRPYRRDGRLSLDALFVLAMGWCWWQDPLYSYVTQSFNYTSVTLNMGGWAEHIPGWQSPHGANIPQPLLWDLSFYVFAMAGGAIGAAALLRKWRARRPQTSPAYMLAVTFVLFIVLDFILEFAWVRVGLYHYAGGVEGLNVFDGRFYTFPLYECLAVGVMMTLMTALRFFVNDRGEAVVERGSAELRFGARGRTFVRYLAIVGALNLCMLFGWAVIVNIFNVHAGAWPKDTQKRSYLVNGLCGAGTDVACPGPHVAIPRLGKSVHIGPDGRIVIPEGTKTERLEVVPLSREK